MFHTTKQPCRARKAVFHRKLPGKLTVSSFIGSVTGAKTVVGVRVVLIGQFAVKSERTGEISCVVIWETHKAIKCGKCRIHPACSGLVRVFYVLISGRYAPGKFVFNLAIAE